MKFSLERDEFSKILKKIDSVCANRGSFARVLSSCMIEAKGSSITVTGTDLEITLRMVENANVSEEGVTIINAHHLLDTVQNLQPGVEVVLMSDGSQVVVEAGNFRAKIPSGDIAEFPAIENLKMRTSLKMPAVMLKGLIDKTMFSISKDDSRADFTGAFLTVTQNGRIQIVSTDGHRLSRAEEHVDIDGELTPALESGVIVPRKGLTELTKNLIDGDICLDVVGSKIVVSIGSTVFQINLIAGRFPDFSTVIPARLEHKAILRRDDFQQALRRASIFAAKTGLTRLILDKGRLDISTNDIKSGEMRDFIDAEYDGAGVIAGFNWRYIDEILSVIDGEEVSMEIIDTDSPVLLRDVYNDKLDFIVMPMQL